MALLAPATNPIQSTHSIEGIVAARGTEMGKDFTPENINLVIEDSKLGGGMPLELEKLEKMSPRLFGMILGRAQERQAGEADPREGLTPQAFSTKDIRAALKEILPDFYDATQAVESLIHRVRFDADKLSLELAIPTSKENPDSTAPVGMSLVDGLIQVQSTIEGEELKFFDDPDKAIAHFKNAITAMETRLGGYAAEGVTLDRAANPKEVGDSIEQMRDAMIDLNLIH